LTILRQRIDVVPEHVEQLVIAHLGRIVHDLHRFGVTGAAVRNLFVAGVDGVPASVAGGGANYAVDLVEIGLQAPEAGAGHGGKGGALRLASLPRCSREQPERDEHAQRDRSADGSYLAPHGGSPELAQADAPQRYIRHFAIAGSANSAHVRAMTA